MKDKFTPQQTPSQVLAQPHGSQGDLSVSSDEGNYHHFKVNETSLLTDDSIVKRHSAAHSQK